MDAKEIVRALRDGTETCAECPYYGEPCGCNRPDGECDGWDIGQAAADLIESLTAEVANAQVHADCMEAKAIAFEQELSASQRREKAAVERLKCLGNAVVPQQAYPIFRAIAEIERGAE